MSITDSYFFLRGRLAEPIRRRDGKYLMTLAVVRRGGVVYYPTVTFREPLPSELKFKAHAERKLQPLLQINGILETHNVDYPLRDYLPYLLRRAGEPGLAPILKGMIPQRAGNRVIERVLYTLTARAADIALEEVPVRPQAKPDPEEATEPEPDPEEQVELDPEEQAEPDSEETAEPEPEETAEPEPEETAEPEPEETTEPELDKPEEQPESDEPEETT
ncbi:MAG: hypothetical protein U9Q70_01285 [Chloroflexota bacterium]|nr:hypothetical protein [Chloroflexota bacterium]